MEGMIRGVASDQTPSPADVSDCVARESGAIEVLLDVLRPRKGTHIMHLEDLVRFSLASHLRADPKNITRDQLLVADLDLRPVDLVWIAMRIEALEVGTDEFPMERLTDVETVGDLIDAFEEWAQQRDTFEQIDFYVAEHDPAPTSGL
jgi:acyl carrier protein